MRYLLDASSLLPLITRHGEKLLTEVTLEDLTTTDLAIYEACNTLWKIVALLKTFSIEDASTTAAVLESLTTKGLIQPFSFKDLSLTKTLERAFKENLTFYDASYIITAEGTQAILVTEDGKLRRAAKKTVKTITFNDLENELKKRDREVMRAI